MTVTEVRKKSHQRKILFGSLLVGGTALGAGMLGLPVATAGGGLIPSWMIYLFCWLFSIATGLLFVEIGLWLPPNANIVTMATELLGKWGRRAVWVLYIFLFYFLTISYVAGGGGLLFQITQQGIPSSLAIVVFTLFFGSFVYMGTKVVGRLNAFLMVGLIISYFIFVGMGSSKMNLQLFERFGWEQALIGLPIIFTSFSYQGVIPSLLEYLNRSARSARLCIIYGTAIPFLAYIFWDLVIKGIVPIEGPHGLLATREAGNTAVSPLSYFLPDSPITTIANIFAFFALTTSFIGVTLGLLHFLADSLHLKRTRANKLHLCTVIFIPTIVVSLINPSIFLSALSLAGGFGCAILLGFMPALMIWVGRYHRKFGTKDVQLFGGRAMLLLLMIAVVVVVAFQIIYGVL